MLQFSVPAGTRLVNVRETTVFVDPVKMWFVEDMPDDTVNIFGLFDVNMP